MNRQQRRRAAHFTSDSVGKTLVRTAGTPTNALSGAEAVRRFEKDPDSILLSLHDCVQMAKESGIGWPEMLAALRSGDLVAGGDPNGTDFKDIRLPAGAVIRWIASIEAARPLQ
jgi:hypothetical protein